MKRLMVGFLACPVCRGELELHAGHWAFKKPENKTVPPGSRPNDPEIIDGVLTCLSCPRWYPIRDRIPELYPDHLRDWERDIEFLKGLEPAIGPAAAESLRSNPAEPPSRAASDPGASFKVSEMTIASRVDDPDFFSPGRTAPFNAADPEYTIRVLRRFGIALSLLDLKPGAVILDIGTGYAWTSEWLFRSGFVAIGLDICRTYLDIGLRRMGAASPHLIAADVENLPLKSGRLDAVLGFDAFHHVPDRRTAMRHVFRVLKTPGRVVLAEPGPGHGTEPHSVEVMRKYGILEKGMSRRDVASYCRDLPAASIREHHIFKLAFGSLSASVRTASDLILGVAAFVSDRLGRPLLSPQALARLKKDFRYSDTRFFTIEKR